MDKIRRRKTVPDSVMKEAKNIYSMFLAAPDLKAQNLDDDTWLAIGKYWDINLWVDDQEQRKATVYPVYYGNTATDQPFPVPLPD